MNVSVIVSVSVNVNVKVNVNVSVDGGQTGARRDHGTTEPNQHTEGSPGPPNLDPETHDLSQAGARHGTRREPNGTTGPSQHTERITGANDAESHKKR